MDREFETVSVMIRKAYDLVSLKPTGRDDETGVFDRSLQLRAPRDSGIKKGDRFKVSVTPIVEVEVTQDPGLDTTIIEDPPQVDPQV
jgi:hypothetical protein